MKAPNLARIAALCLLSLAAAACNESDSEALSETYEGVLTIEAGQALTLTADGASAPSALTPGEAALEIATDEEAATSLVLTRADQSYSFSLSGMDALEIGATHYFDMNQTGQGAPISAKVGAPMLVGTETHTEYKYCGSDENGALHTNVEVTTRTYDRSIEVSFGTIDSTEAAFQAVAGFKGATRYTESDSKSSGTCY